MGNQLRFRAPGIALSFFISASLAFVRTAKADDAPLMEAKIVADPVVSTTLAAPTATPVTTAGTTTLLNPTATMATTTPDNSGMILAGTCMSMLSALLGGGNAKNSQTVIDAVDRANNEAGFREESDFDPEVTRSLAQDVRARFDGTCEQKFIDKEGRLGPWGREIRTQITMPGRERVFSGNEPPDVVSGLCPGYKSFDKTKRELFWVHVFMSMASPESSCREHIPGQVIGKDPIGLFQVEPNSCNAVGVQGDLRDGLKNTRCAVALLAAELGRRPNLQSPTSKDSDYRRTHWGVLRTDDDNFRRGGDIKGAQKFRALVTKFPGCK